LLLWFRDEFRADPAFTAAVDEPAPSKTDSATACEEAGNESVVKARVKVIPRRTFLSIRVTPTYSREV
jgi:hypothetical protein